MRVREIFSSVIKELNDRYGASVIGITIRQFDAGGVVAWVEPNGNDNLYRVSNWAWSSGSCRVGIHSIRDCPNRAEALNLLTSLTA